MTDVQETKLPGVGVRHDFETSGGRRIGVIVHHAGHRELLIYDDDDPDLCRESLRIDEHEAYVLAEMLGAARVQEQIDLLQQSIEGLKIDWLPVAADSSFATRTIGELALRQRTGVTIIAVIRGDQTVPSPGPDVRLDAGDTAVVVGAPHEITQAAALLRDG